MRADYMPNVVDDFQTFIGWQHQAISHIYNIYIYIYCWCYHLVWLLRNCQERNFGTTAATSMSVAAVAAWRRQRYEKVEEIKKQLETKKEDQHGPTVVLSCNRINEWLVQGSMHFLNGHVFFSCCYVQEVPEKWPFLRLGNDFTKSGELLASFSSV